MAVRLILSVVVGLALSLSPAAYAMKQLELKSHSHIAAIDIPLSGKEKAWLAAQPTLTVGTWLPERTPIVYDGDEKSYQGINADYLALMAHSLGLKVIIRQYDTEQQALTALADSSVTRLGLVARPQTSSLAEASRTADELAEAGVHATHLVINGILPSEPVSDVLADAIRAEETAAIAAMPVNLAGLAIDRLPLR